MPNDPKHQPKDSEQELSEDQLEQVAGGRSPAEEFVLGRDNIFGGTTGGAGGGGSGGGDKLIAHELTHVAQQGSGGSGAGRGKK